jgi:hypothetical protein
MSQNATSRFCMKDGRKNDHRKNQISDYHHTWPRCLAGCSMKGLSVGEVNELNSLLGLLSVLYRMLISELA